MEDHIHRNGAFIFLENSDINISKQRARQTDRQTDEKCTRPSIGLKSRISRGIDRYWSGSGLGLSLSRQIVLGHGGDIFVESEAGKGSRFTVVVPVFEG